MSSRVELPSCPVHNRLLSHAESLALTCSWCFPEKFRSLRTAASAAMFGELAVNDAAARAARDEEDE